MINTASDATFSVHQPEYDHTQIGPIYWLIWVPALAILFIVAFNAPNETDRLGLVAGGLIVTLVAFSFRSLRIVDAGDTLLLRYGPVPIFHKRFAYADITAAKRDRSSVIDGWGIHWFPGRGWTYNLWGLDCVRLTLSNGRTIRLGTDDPTGLEQFLRLKCLGSRDGE